MEKRPNHRPRKVLITDKPLKADFYTIDEVADIFKVHASTIRRAIKDSRLKAVKIGRKWLLRKDDITNYGK